MTNVNVFPVPFLASTIVSKNNTVNTYFIIPHKPVSNDAKKKKTKYYCGFFSPFPAAIVGIAATCMGEAFSNPQSVKPCNNVG